MRTGCVSGTPGSLNLKLKKYATRRCGGVYLKGVLGWQNSTDSK